MSDHQFNIGDRVVMEHPRYGRHYASVVGPHHHDEEPAYVVRVDGPYVNPEWAALDSWLRPPLAARDMVIGDLLNLQMLKELIEKPFLGSLWTKGDSGMLTPHVCECSFGNGLKLLRIATINQRPNYHVVRIDSGWDNDNAGHGELVAEHIDDIISAIENEVGRMGTSLDQPCDNCGDTICKCDPHFDRDAAWPEIDADGGCSWGTISWTKLLNKAA